MTEQLSQSCKDLLDSLKNQGQDLVESSTRDQSAGSSEWIEQRKKRLTASTIRRVTAKRDNTDPSKFIQSIISPPTFQSQAMADGLQNETMAIEQYEKVKNCKVARCGLLPHPDFPMLAASVDGLVFCSGQPAIAGDWRSCDGILEIKYLASSANSTIEAAMTKRDCCLIESNGTITLRRQHTYFDQIQLQLAVTGKEWCDLFVFTGPIHNAVVRLSVDNEWQRENIPKCVQFWKEFIAPSYIEKKARSTPFYWD